MFAFHKYKLSLLVWVGISFSIILCGLEHSIYGTIPGFLLLFFVLRIFASKISKLNHIVSNSMYANATITSIEDQNFSKIFHCMFKTQDDYLIEATFSNNTYNYLCIGSIVPILYQQDNPQDIMFCPEWGTWQRKHLLDHYLYNIDPKSRSMNEKAFHKQRNFNFQLFFSFKCFISGFGIILLTMPIMALVSSCCWQIAMLINQAPIKKGMFVASGALLFMTIIFSCIYYCLINNIIKYCKFYEYFIPAKGIITDKQIDSSNSRYINYIYKYTFITKNNIHYCGSMSISASSLRFDPKKYNINDSIIILYDSCNISTNYLAIQYPEYLKIASKRH